MSDSQTPEQLKQQMQQNRQPLKRQLPFSTKPPFMASGGDYHRFASTEPRRVADHEAEAIVVKSPVSSFALLWFKPVNCGFFVRLVVDHEI